MKLRLVVDTSAYAQMRRGNEDALRTIAGAEIVIMPAVVLGELEAGFRGGNRYRENALVLEQFLDEPFVTTAAVTRGIAQRYGTIFASLRARGTPIPTNDIWIAATALSESAHLVTFDCDFKAVDGLDFTLLKA